MSVRTPARALACVDHRQGGHAKARSWGLGADPPLTRGVVLCGCNMKGHTAPRSCPCGAYMQHEPNSCLDPCAPTGGRLRVRNTRRWFLDLNTVSWCVHATQRGYCHTINVSGPHGEKGCYTRPRNFHLPLGSVASKRFGSAKNLAFPISHSLTTLLTSVCVELIRCSRVRVTACIAAPFT